MGSISQLSDVLFIRLQTSILCKSLVHEGGKTSLVDWVYGIVLGDSTPFYIVHEWCCSLESSICCLEQIQIVDPDGEIEATLRMSPFLLGERFWDLIRNYWEVKDFYPTKIGTYEIRTTLIEVESERVLYRQIDPLHVLM
ncbi:hypothetical protein [Sulfoacidibacillus thermotolerans]|uniref:Uncharacterized protein n=1 Tax=Sulfoacidibacillus thermotolerans TaxID=1765684 RepID=A0A2U3D998_SULT2|nr:hypothetical protein [Sulfoacidibacillus thermotolerans]PWI57857.1 hypothetical protein BM613_06655 [Sulfoacidibacillus thermotolerans]